MKNPFKKAVKNLIKDFNDYDYLLGDLEVYEFYKNNSREYINNNDFILKYPISHKFILLEYIITYVGFIEGSSYINSPINERKKNSSELEIEKYLDDNIKSSDLLIYILKGYREAFYDKEINGNENSESKELIDAGNALIPIMKYLYSVSDEFK